MKSDEFDNQWSNWKNWKWHLFYNCKDDPRVIVPKRPKWMGWTLNFAHKKAYAVLAMTLSIPLLLIGAGALFGLMNSVYYTIFMILAILAIVIYYSSTDMRVDKVHRRTEK